MTRLREKYDGLPFTRKQVDQIGSLLGIEAHAACCEVAFSIAIILERYYLAVDAEKRSGSAEEVRKKLERAASAAAALVELLDDSSIFEPPRNFLSELGSIKPELKGFSRPTLWHRDDISSDDLKKLMSNIVRSTNKMIQSDKILRGYYFIRPYSASNNSLYTAIMWPDLFLVWEDHGNIVAGSKHGTNKFHQFISLIHSAMGLNFSHNTLNKAIQRWKREPRQ